MTTPSAGNTVVTDFLLCIDKRLFIRSAKALIFCIVKDAFREYLISVIPRIADTRSGSFFVDLTNILCARLCF